MHVNLLTDILHSNNIEYLYCYTTPLFMRIDCEKRLTHAPLYGIYINPNSIVVCPKHDSINITLCVIINTDNLDNLLYICNRILKLKAFL